jgi:hypothetical protein
MIVFDKERQVFYIKNDDPEIKFFRQKIDNFFKKKKKYTFKNEENFKSNKTYYKKFTPLSFA